MTSKITSTWVSYLLKKWNIHHWKSDQAWHLRRTGFFQKSRHSSERPFRSRSAQAIEKKRKKMISSERRRRSYAARGVLAPISDQRRAPGPSGCAGPAVGPARAGRADHVRATTWVGGSSGTGAEELRGGGLSWPGRGALFSCLSREAIIFVRQSPDVGLTIVLFFWALFFLLGFSFGLHEESLYGLMSNAHQKKKKKKKPLEGPMIIHFYLRNDTSLCRDRSAGSRRSVGRL